MPGDLLLVIGAGASFDCGDQAGGTCDLQYRPPLAANLFDRNPTQLAVLQRYSRAAALLPQLSKRVKGRERFEDVMRQFATSPSEHVREMYQEVPFYIQDLLRQSTEKFTRGHGTHYDHLVQIIAERHRGGVSVLSTNYDQLFESAWSRLTNASFDSLDSYWSGESGWTLTKPHGCISWGWPMYNATISEPFSLKVSGGKLALGDVELMPYAGTGLYRGEKWYHPAILPPEANKRTVACPQKQFEALRGGASRASKMLVIGFSGLDTHLLPSLQAAGGVRHLLIANGTADAGRETLDQLHRHVWLERRAFSEGDVVFDGGFADLMASDRLSFLSAD